MPTVDQGLGSLRLVEEILPVLDAKHQSALSGRRQHPLGVDVRPCHRFFAEYVLSRLKSRQRNRHVKVIMEADVHRHDVVARQQLSEIGVNAGDSILTGYPPGLGLVNVGNRRNLHVRHPGIHPDMLLADLADADNSDSSLFLCHLTFSWCELLVRCPPTGHRAER